MDTRRCRFCRSPLDHVVVDLGMSPLANRLVSPTQAHEMEPFYPLRAYVCGECFLVQLEEFETPDRLFTDYAYFSSYSDSWVQHAKACADMAVERFGLGSESLVVEVASNDGYLLQHFVARGIPVVGIDPAANVAEAARRRGVPTIVQFLGLATARDLVAQGLQGDLVIGNNVLAHVPTLNDFVAGLWLLLKPQGVLIIEVPHVMRLMAENQFDTIYHEHFSYFSLLTLNRIFAAHRLLIFDVEELPTHGGSLRIYACRDERDQEPRSARVAELMAREEAAGLRAIHTYTAFGERVKDTKRTLLEFLITAKREGKSIAGYGAPGKSTTLLNYCGIRTDFLDYTVDRSPHKQGRYLPGTRIPIHHPDRLAETRPDYVLILPWNLKEEIMETMAGVRDWGGQFVVPIPEVKIY